MRANFNLKTIIAGMLEANTDYLKRIRFIIRSKLLKNSDGSRSMSVDETETQRGMCTLGYTCIEDLKTPELKYLKVIVFMKRWTFLGVILQRNYIRYACNWFALKQTQLTSTFSIRSSIIGRQSGLLFFSIQRERKIYQRN